MKYRSDCSSPLSVPMKSQLLYSETCALNRFQHIHCNTYVIQQLYWLSNVDMLSIDNNYYYNIIVTILQNFDDITINIMKSAIWSKIIVIFCARTIFSFLGPKRCPQTQHHFPCTDELLAVLCGTVYVLLSHVFSLHDPLSLSPLISCS